MHSSVTNSFNLDAREYGDNIPLFQAQLTDLQDIQLQREHLVQLPC
jgi:hypothetical protein